MQVGTNKVDFCAEVEVLTKILDEILTKQCIFTLGRESCMNYRALCNDNPSVYCKYFERNIESGFCQLLQWVRVCLVTYYIYIMHAY